MAVRQWTIFLAGRWPGWNELHPTNHSIANRKIKLAWQEGAALQIKGLRIPRLNRVWLIYVHHRKDRRHDKSNLASAAMKILEDAIVDVGIIPDDGWNFVEGFEHHFEHRPKEGIQLTIMDVGQIVPPEHRNGDNS